MRTRMLRGIAIGCVVLSAGCSLAPQYARPEAPVPDVWPANHDAPRVGLMSTGLETGWESFVRDDALRDLITLALSNNRDLRVAMLNVRAARGQYRIERADRLPTLAASAEGTRQRLTPATDPAGVGGVQESFRSGIAMAQFELDLFGRLQSLSNAALNEYFATEEAEQSARITLITEVIQAYAQREGIYRQLNLTNEIAEARDSAHERIVLRRSAGVASALEVEESVTLTNQARADSERLDRQFRQATNALVLLVGTSNGESALPAPRGSTMPILSEIAAGAPSELLAYRPDIRAAEYRLQARNANIGAARAAFFPSISLTGSLGSASPEFSDLYRSSNRIWSFSPQINLPIFSGGRNVANLDVAEARKDIAVAEYEKSIQTAFREVADAISAQDTLRREQAALSTVVRSSREAARLSEARYRAGLDSYLRYLDAQRTQYASEIASIEVETQRQVAASGMFRALGGAWHAQADLPLSKAP